MLPCILTYGGTYLPQEYVQRCTCVCCGTLSGFPLQYHLPVALAFDRGAAAKPSRDFLLPYRLLIVLAFERGAVVRLSRHNQAHHLSVKRLGLADSQFVSHFESKYGLKTYRKHPSRPIIRSNQYFGGLGTRNTYYQGQGERQYPTPHLRAISIKSFSLREYCTRCSSTFSIKPFVNKKKLASQLYTTSTPGQAD